MTPLEMRATDKNTQYNHIPTLVLMENAGSKIADYIIRNYNDKRKVSIYSGTGGNGGDGFVIARHLLNHGYNVRLFLLAREENIKNQDSITNFESIKVIAQTDKNLSLSIITDSTQIQPDNSDIIVDAILGTGVNGKLRQPISAAVDVINYSPAIVLSVDVPSGLNPENGQVSDKTVVAHTTLTLHKMKTGLLMAQKSYVGEVKVLDIGIPKVSEEYVGEGDLLKLKVPKADSHKGQNGSVLIVGSNPDYIGAVVFAANACLTQSIDLVYIVAPADSANIIKHFNPEFIVKPVEGKILSMDAYETIEDLSKRVDSILIGSGAGIEDETAKLFNKIVSTIKKPIVVDADALKLVSSDLIDERIILTPHKGEFTKFFDLDVPKKLDDRIVLLTDLSKSYGATILLKDVVDVISSPEDYKLNKTGNQGMTIGGTGDLLAGLTVSLAAKNTPFEAAYLASFILGSAADKVLLEKGFNYGVDDILKELGN
ncbi:MAG: hypothetical protein BZ138_03470 [Methanosphaera sp. rholeuAM270]|nr:MAG: hypothetical protein BZ138_03470 [Methanosphaera sp. rholeuAM270]